MTMSPVNWQEKMQLLQSWWCLGESWGDLLSICHPDVQKFTMQLWPRKPSERLQTVLSQPPSASQVIETILQLSFKTLFEHISSICDRSIKICSLTFTLQLTVRQLKIAGLLWIKLVSILNFYTISRLIETKHYKKSYVSGAYVETCTFLS